VYNKFYTTKMDWMLSRKRKGKINSSISRGEFPSMWKEALVTPILKKGDPTKNENYRPMSCLSVASKVLEK